MEFRKLQVWFDVFCVFYTSVLFALLLSVQGQSAVIGPLQPIVAAVGDDIILPCYLDPAVDVSDMTVEWTRPDLESRLVHLWPERAELQNPSYRGRTSLFINELQHGNISLKISKVKLSDEGTYRCFVLDLQRDSAVRLVVGAASSPVAQMNSSSSRVELQCESAGWYPEPELLWLDAEGNLLPAAPAETLRGPDGLYAVSSRVTVEKKHSNKFTCRVQQKNINQSRETHMHVPDDFFISPSGPPSDPTDPTSITGLVIGAVVVVVLLLLLVVFFVVWKRRRDKSRKKKKSEEDEAEQTRKEKMIESKNDNCGFHVEVEEGESDPLMAGREEEDDDVDNRGEQNLKEETETQQDETETEQRDANRPETNTSTVTEKESQIKMKQETPEEQIMTGREKTNDVDRRGEQRHEDGRETADHHVTEAELKGGLRRSEEETRNQFILTEKESQSATGQETDEEQEMRGRGMKAEEGGGEKKIERGKDYLGPQFFPLSEAKSFNFTFHLNTDQEPQREKEKQQEQLEENRQRDVIRKKSETEKKRSEGNRREVFKAEKKRREHQREKQLEERRKKNQKKKESENQRKKRRKEREKDKRELRIRKNKNHHDKEEKREERSEEECEHEEHGEGNQRESLGMTERKREEQRRVKREEDQREMMDEEVTFEGTNMKEREKLQLRHENVQDGRKVKIDDHLKVDDAAHSQHAAITQQHENIQRLKEQQMLSEQKEPQGYLREQWNKMEQEHSGLQFPPFTEEPKEQQPEAKNFNLTSHVNTDQEPQRKKETQQEQFVEQRQRDEMRKMSETEKKRSEGNRSEKFMSQKKRREHQREKQLEERRQKNQRKKESERRREREKDETEKQIRKNTKQHDKEEKREERSEEEPEHEEHGEGNQRESLGMTERKREEQRGQEESRKSSVSSKVTLNTHLKIQDRRGENQEKQAEETSEESREESREQPEEQRRVKREEEDEEVSSEGANRKEREELQLRHEGALQEEQQVNMNQKEEPEEPVSLTEGGVDCLEEPQKLKDEAADVDQHKIQSRKHMREMDPQEDCNLPAKRQKIQEESRSMKHQDVRKVNNDDHMEVDDAAHSQHAAITQQHENIQRFKEQQMLSEQKEPQGNLSEDDEDQMEVEPQREK